MDYLNFFIKTYGQLCCCWSGSFGSPLNNDNEKTRVVKKNEKIFGLSFRRG